MKIILFAWALFSVLCSVASTNDYAAIAAQDDAPNLILSEATNSLRSGLWINSSNHVIVIHNGQTATETSLAMLNTSTTNVNFWTPWPKNIRSQFEINLVDELGQSIPKTATGKEFGRSYPEVPDGTPVWKASEYGLSGDFLPPNGDSLYSLSLGRMEPMVADCFDLKRSGNYKFSVIHHVFVAAAYSNGVFLKPITFSPVTVCVRVETDR